MTAVRDLRVLFFLQTDCPTCQLIAPYLNAAARGGARIAGVSQDDDASTAAFVAAMDLSFPVDVDRDLRTSRAFDPLAVPTLMLLDGDGRVIETHTGFDKAALNALASSMGFAPWARMDDGAPESKNLLIAAEPELYRRLETVLASLGVVD